MCVEHLNRCKNSYWSYSKQGAAGNVIVLQPTKTAMTFCDIDPGRWIDVPAGGFSSSWHGAKPRTPARLSQSDDYSFIGYLDRYLCASVHFRMLNSGCIISIWALFHLSYLHLGHPEEYVEEDSLLSRTNPILLAWDSVPNRFYDGSFLV